MFKCKSAVLTPEGGIKTVWEDTECITERYEIEIPPADAEGIINYDKFIREANNKGKKKSI